MQLSPYSNFRTLASRRGEACCLGCPTHFRALATLRGWARACTPHRRPLRLAPVTRRGASEARPCHRPRPFPSVDSPRVVRARVDLVAGGLGVRALGAQVCPSRGWTPAGGGRTLCYAERPRARPLAEFHHHVCHSYSGARRMPRPRGEVLFSVRFARPARLRSGWPCVATTSETASSVSTNLQPLGGQWHLGVHRPLEFSKPALPCPGTGPKGQPAGRGAGSGDAAGGGSMATESLRGLRSVTHTHACLPEGTVERVHMALPGLGVQGGPPVWGEDSEAAVGWANP